LLRVRLSAYVAIAHETASELVISARYAALTFLCGSARKAFFGVSDNPVVVGPTVNDTAKFSVAGYFDYDTATNALALLPDPFAYRVYENGILADNCCGGLIPGSGATFSDNTISLSSAALPLFTLTALKPLDGSSPIIPGSGFAFVIAPFGTSTTGAFVYANSPPPLPTPLPPALPMFRARHWTLGNGR
jgi:hypothetical protein